MRAILVPHSDIPAAPAGAVDVAPDATVERLGDVLDVVRRWNAALTPWSSSSASRRAVLVLLVLAAALAGWVDAVSGGGGLIQLPALLVALPDARAGDGARHQQALVDHRHLRRGA